MTVTRNVYNPLTDERIDYEFTPGTTYNKLFDLYEEIDLTPGPFYNTVFDKWLPLTFTLGDTWDPVWGVWRDPAEMTGDYWRPGGGGGGPPDPGDSAQAYTYYRLLIEAKQSSNTSEFVSIGEFELYDELDGDNLIDGETVATASSFSDSNVASRAIDGNSGNWWTSDANGAVGQWLKVQFDEPKTVRFVRVFGAQSNLWTPRDFKIQGSNDNDTWTDLGTITDHPARDSQIPRRIYRIQGTAPEIVVGSPARFYRLRLTGVADGTFRGTRQLKLRETISGANFAPSALVQSLPTTEASYPPANAINENETNGWLVNTSASLVTALVLTLPESHPVLQYDLSTASVSLGFSIVAFNLDASNDGFNWVTLDSRSELTWSASEIKVFNVEA